MHNFRKMNIWGNAIDFTKEIYSLSNCFPTAERYGLTSQLQRAAVSIAANIAEGSGRGNVEFQRFLRMAVSSAYEVETLLIIANKINYIPDESLVIFVDKVQSMQRGINKFISQLDTPS